jgi:DNA-binding response OmpR family regulator
MTGKLLLLVEDEVLIAHSLEDALTEAGFEVQLASDGTQGLRALEASAREISALVTDIRLPLGGPDGFDLAHRARELSPSIAILYMSGDSAGDWASKGVPKSVMLAKPFAIAQLITAVSQLLNDPASQGL